MNKNISSKSTPKNTKGDASSHVKKKQNTAPKSPRYTTWLKYVAMLIGVVGVVFIMLGSYGTFRALIHQMNYEHSATQEGSKKLPPRAPDGSRMPVEKTQEEPQEVREALQAAEQEVKTSSAAEKANKAPVEPHKPNTPVHQDTLPSTPAVPVAPAPIAPSAPATKTHIFDPSHPKMVIVIDDIGENLADVRALLSLDFPVTFAIWPHATHTKKAAMLIYSEGKEIIMHQPMQALNDKVDPGQGALYVGMSSQEIRATLQANLALVPHAVGLNNHMGSRFTEDKGILTVCDVLKERGMFALDSLTHAGSIFYAEAQKKGLKSARRNVFLDAVAGEKNVLFELNRAEGIAKKNGLGIAIGHPFVTTISGLKAWSKIRDKSIAIVRLSAIVH